LYERRNRLNAQGSENKSELNEDEEKHGGIKQTREDDEKWKIVNFKRIFWGEFELKL
jgi:hypothetical protein